MSAINSDVLKVLAEQVKHHLSVAKPEPVGVWNKIMHFFNNTDGSYHLKRAKTLLDQMISTMK